MQDTFIVNQNLNLIEYYRAAMYLGIRNKRLRKIYYFILGMPLLLGLFSVFFTHENWRHTVFDFFLLIMLPILFFYVGTFILSCLIMLIKPSLVRNITYEFNHWGMVKKGIGIDYSNPWRSFTKLRETKYFLLLYISENDAHIIQKRMFPTNAELETFKEFADQNIWSNT